MVSKSASGLRNMILLSIISVLFQSVNVKATSEKEEKSPEAEPPQVTANPEVAVKPETLAGYKNPITQLEGMIFDKSGNDAGTYAKHEETKKAPKDIAGVHSTGDRLQESYPVWIKTQVRLADGQTIEKYRVGVCENMKLGNDNNIVKFTDDGKEQYVTWNDVNFALPENAQTLADYNKEVEIEDNKTRNKITDEVDGVKHYYHGEDVSIKHEHTQGGYVAKVLTGPDAGKYTRVNYMHLETPITKIGFSSMALGGASGITAIVLGALLGTDNLNMGSFSFGDVNGFYFFVIVLAIAALATAVTGACFGNKTGTGLLIAAGVLALGSGGFGVAIGCGAELGKVAINDVSVATVTIIGFSALAITAFIWGLCCFKRKVICSRTARC